MSETKSSGEARVKSNGSGPRPANTFMEDITSTVLKTGPVGLLIGLVGPTVVDVIKYYLIYDIIKTLIISGTEITVAMYGC